MAHFITLRENVYRKRDSEPKASTRASDASPLSEWFLPGWSSAGGPGWGNLAPILAERSAVERCPFANRTEVLFEPASLRSVPRPGHGHRRSFARIGFDVQRDHSGTAGSARRNRVAVPRRHQSAVRFERIAQPGVAVC
ncbi:hypothetical protein GCM10027563_43520 [Parasphingorhabdus pacifica]